MCVKQWQPKHRRWKTTLPGNYAFEIIKRPHVESHKLTRLIRSASNMINKNVPLWLTTNLDVSSSFINYCHSALKNTMLRVQALRIQSNSRSCAFLVQSRAFNVNRRELGSTADNCSQHTPPKNYPTEMQVDHVLDKLYKQVESDDDDFFNLQHSKVVHDEHTLQISLTNIKTMAYCARERLSNEHWKNKSKKSNLTNHNRIR